MGHPPVETEAAAIIESVRYCKHYLTGCHFTLITHQKSVAYMFEKKHKGRIKNDKINRWRLELSCDNFDIRYRPGNENIVYIVPLSALTHSLIYTSRYVIRELHVCQHL